MYKPEWLSEGAELLLERLESSQEPYDIVIVGSGYGGAVAAARLAQRLDEKGKPLTVCVLERGREHLPGTFPNSFSELPGHVRFSRSDDPVAKGVREGLFDLRIGKDVSVLVASGLGGGSLINAGLTAEPELDVFDERWPEAIRKELGTQKSLATYYGPARKKLRAHEARTEKHDKRTEELDKHKQFKKFAERLEVQAKRARITVDPGVCVQCGDCATGCNIGAKNTLSKTYLAEAWQHGAKLYTGATVSHIEKRREGWAVFLALTAEPRPLQEQKLCEIHAKNVILAAGALGSTEVLMRSKERCRELQLSSRLGTKFSTNGDMISALYAQRKRVNAAANESDPLRGRYVGPTITGITRKGAAREDRIVIEELAIPGALRRVFEELLTTSATLESLGHRDEDEHEPGSTQDPAARKGDKTRPPEVDPAAVDPQIIDRCQVFAAMGDDGANGRLELVPGWNDPAHLGRVYDGAIRVHWPKAGQEDVYDVQDKYFASVTELGEIYLRNPLWQPIPAGLSGVLSGAKPTGMLFSVHPLGGCPMGDDVEKGVVDHMGQVFDPAKPSEPGKPPPVHEGLLVLDGSIVPTALGTNPLLTITALAERAIERYCDEVRHWHKKAPPQSLPALPKKPHVDEPPIAAPAVTALRFSERMTGDLKFHRGGKAVPTELTLDFEPVGDLAKFLRDPLHPLKLEKGTLKVLDPAGQASKDVQVTGSVELLVRGASKPNDRMYSALSTYLDTRGAADVIGEVRDRKIRPLYAWAIRWIAPVLWPFARAWWRLGNVKNLLARLDSVRLFRQYVTLASRVGEVRYLFYKLIVPPGLKDSAGNTLLEKDTEIRGRKILRYAAGENPWRQLIDLKLTAHPPKKPAVELGTLTVDPAYLFHGFASRLKITKQRDLPAAWMDLASLALFIGRLILKIHFWSFRLPEYQKYDPMRDTRRLPGPLKPLHMERHIVGYPETPRDAGVFLPVTRYCRYKSNPGKPVLLIHGLGSGGIQFATGRVNPNMARHLADWDFDVWVAELRTSIALPCSLDQWTLDEVARQDIPRIVDLVLDKTGARQIDVVAHCIGSAMFCTAVLDGKLQHDSGESKIRRAVLLQVGPLITLSKGTRLRGLVGAPLRRFLPDGFVDFSVDDRADWMQAMIDRLLTTYPYPPEEAKHHRLGWSWKRNSHIANCNRWAGIDGRMFRHDNLTRKMLDGLGEVLGHSSLTTWTQTLQYAFLERLTDSEARNSYVTAENIREYFTFPVRFLHGSENDVFHPLTSLRSHELLKRVHGSDFPADVRILQGYGHFDPLIGKNAVVDVFRHVVGFLGDKHVAWKRSAQKPAVHFFARRPLIGPVLGWVRWDKATRKWWARIWCRIDDLRSPAKCVVVQVLKGGKGIKSKIIRCPTNVKPGDKIKSLVVGPIDTTLCLDMPLGDQDGCYEIVVLSLHETFEAKLSGEHQAAEVSAGKARSASEPHLTLPDSASLVKALKDPAQVLELRKKAARYSPDDVDYDDKIDCAKVDIPQQAESDTVTFAFGSCRYPGWLFDREQADATFGEIKELMKKDKQDPKHKSPSALLLIGDQIYADATAGAFDPKDRRERFYEAYREAWTAPSARDVLSRLPVYMMMDDHEAGDNWHPQDFLGEEEKAMRNEGIEAFKRYQWVHSPGYSGQPKPPSGVPDVFSYSFELQGFPIFVCDTRSGRNGQDSMLDTKQFQALQDWLEAGQSKCGDRPKFVVSPSVVVPALKATGSEHYASRSDGWDGFPKQLAELLAFIFQKSIENVVFLCGDSHFSMRSRISFEDAGGEVGPTATCIVASPMYAPYPFANSTQEQYEDAYRPLALPGIAPVMRYRVTEWGGSRASFTVVTAEKRGGKWFIESDVLPKRGPAKRVASAGTCTRPLPAAVPASAARRGYLGVPPADQSTASKGTFG